MISTMTTISTSKKTICEYCETPFQLTNEYLETHRLEPCMNCIENVRSQLTSLEYCRDCFNKLTHYVCYECHCFCNPNEVCDPYSCECSCKSCRTKRKHYDCYLESLEEQSRHTNTK